MIKMKELLGSDKKPGKQKKWCIKLSFSFNFSKKLKEENKQPSISHTISILSINKTGKNNGPSQKSQRNNEETGFKKQMIICTVTYNPDKI